MSTVRLGSLASLLILLTVMAPASHAEEPLRFATTTSTANSGLIDYLLPHFTRETGIRVQVSAIGTGQALRMGRMGEVDVILAHAPSSEKRFVTEGYGLKCVSIMRNSFVLVGPGNDPAGIREADSIETVMNTLSEGQYTFISRGDDSGTHNKEMSIWRSIDTNPFGSWYHEAGQGMKATLEIADTKQAYTLIDIGTWLALEDQVNLSVVHQSSALLLQNPYSIIAVNPAKFENGSINHEDAAALVRWISSAEGQALIGKFRMNDTVLFVPTAVRTQVDP